MMMNPSPAAFTNDNNDDFGSMLFTQKDVWKNIVVSYLSPMDVTNLRVSCKFFNTTLADHEETNYLLYIFRGGVRDSDNYVDFVYWAAVGGHVGFIKHCLESVGERFCNYREFFVLGAARGNQVQLLYLYLNLDEDDLNDALKHASLGGHRQLVKDLITLGATDWFEGIEGAARGGHRYLVEFFLQKDVKTYFTALHAAVAGGQLDIISLIEPACLEIYSHVMTPKDFANTCLIEAVREGHFELVIYYICRGANRWKRAMCVATLAGNRRLVYFFCLTKGANNFLECHDIARSKGFEDLQQFFKCKLRENKRKRRRQERLELEKSKKIKYIVIE